MCIMINLLFVANKDMAIAVLEYDRIQQLVSQSTALAVKESAAASVSILFYTLQFFVIIKDSHVGV